MKEIVIKIPDEVYERIFTIKPMDLSARNIIAMAIRDGEVLPKGHGRLIDADDVNNHIIGFVNLNSCPTIIKADKGEE